MAETPHTTIVAEIKSKIDCRELFHAEFPDHYQQAGNSLCPWHADSTPSLKLEKRRVICFGACATNGKPKSRDAFEIMMQSRELRFAQARRLLAERCGIVIDKPKQRNTAPEAVYPYVDEDGVLLFQVLRYSGKQFKQRRPNGRGRWTWSLGNTRRVLFNLPDILNAAPDAVIVIVEGERDVLTAQELGFVATCNPGGAGKWRSLCERWNIHEPLRDRYIWVIPDNDEPGCNHATNVARSLTGFAQSVKIVNLPGLPEHGDLTDVVEQHGPEEAKRRLLELAAEAREYAPGEQELTAPAPVPQIHLTDMGNAHRMADLFGDRIRYCHEIGWLTYDGRRWSPDKTSQVQAFGKQMVKQLYADAANEADENERKRLASHALKCESASRIQCMIALLPSEPGISVPHDIFDADPMALNVLNGTLDLRTGELRSHSPADYITELAPIAYDPAATCPRWEQFIHEIMDGDEELIGFWPRLLGYCITGKTIERCWVYLYGPKGANGKSVLVRTVSYVLGSYAVNAAVDTFLESKFPRVRNDLAALRGARLVTAGEPDRKRRFDAGVLKAFCGEDDLTVRFLHRECFSFRPTGKLLLHANPRLAVNDTGEAFWERLIMVPFNRSFNEAERDPRLDEKLKAEAPGILAWMVRGCLDWQANGLDIPAAVRAANDDYRASVDPLADFLEKHCVLHRQAQTRVSDLYDRFSEYCKRQGIKPWSRQTLNEDLAGRRFINRTKAGARSARYDAWSGIGLRDDEHGVTSHESRCSRCNLEGEACETLYRSVKRDPERCSFFDSVQ